jgi:hypothetical protein
MPLIKDEPLLYRFGFVCVFADEFPSGEKWEELRSEWKRTKTGGFTIFSHPEALVTPVSDTSVLIGHAFAPGGGRSVRDLLESALASDSDSALHEALDDLSGRFALVTSRWGGRVYHDAMGSRTVFYRDGEPPGVASHGALIGELFGAAVDTLAEEISLQPEYASRGVTYLPGDLSVHEGVRALAPNNYYDVAARKSVRYWPRKPRKEATLEEFHSLADAHFDGFAEYLSGRFRPVLGVTPGVDSRAIIAAFRHRGIPMEYVTWTGRAMPGKDVPVAREMAAYLGGRHTFLPEAGQRGSETFHRVNGLAAKNAGHFSGGTEIAAYMYQAFEERRDLVFVRGYGAEIVRGFYGIGKRPRIEEFSVPDLIRTYSLGMKVKHPSKRYIELVSGAVERFMERAGYEGLDSFGYDMNDLYYWESRMGMWGASLHNEMDVAMPSLPGFNSRRLFEAAFGLKAEERLTNELLLGLARRYDEGLARFPVNPSKAKKPGKVPSPPENRLREELEEQRERNKVLARRLRAREAELRAIKQSRLWRYTRFIRNVLSATRSRMSRRSGS